MTERRLRSSRAKATYAAGMRAIAGAVRGRLLAGTAPSRDQRVRHYLRSLLAIYDVEAMVALDVPWWSYRSIDVVDDWLAARGPDTRIFEFGAGASTLWLAQRCGEVVSVEHDASFAAVLQPMLVDRPRVDLRVCPPTSAGAGGVRSGRAGYEGLDFSEYIAQIDAVGGLFDLVIVDGRARNHALEAAQRHLAPGGLIVFDNANRARYRESMTQVGLPVRRFRGLTPAVPYPTTTALLGPS